MERRAFFKISALASGGFLLSISSLAENILSASPVEAGISENKSRVGNFLQIKPDNSILFQLTKHEMGQGVATSLAMILAEELGADWANVKIDFVDADLATYQNPQQGGLGTGGSTTILDMYPILRRAGAVARETFRQAGAKHWNVPSADCIIEKGFVVHTSSNRKVSLGDLASIAAQMPVPENVLLKSEKDFQLVGSSQSGKLIPDIVTGKLSYGLDAKLPDMLYAVVARCPVYRGRIKSFDASKALKVKGVKKVVTTKAVAGIKGHFQFDIREGVAVLADSFWAAKKGREALVIEWEEGKNSGKNITQFEDEVAQRAMVRTDPTGFIGDENATSNVEEVRKTLRASYVYPYQLHSFMEPLNCTAHFKGNSCELHIGVQAPHNLVRQIMSVFKLEQDKITVHLHPSGGGFGRRWYPDAGLEALCISKEAGNIPIKMIWTREDDQTVNHAHCYVHSHYQASLNEQNNLVAWYQKELRTYTWDSAVANPELTWIGYAIPNIRYDFENLLEDSLVQSCAWRSVVANAWAFGQECFIDEIAAEVKKDPLEFRLSLLRPGREAVVGHSNKVSNDRLIRVLKLAAEKGNWHDQPKEKGKGKGISVYPYMHGNSYCAMVAEVTVDGTQLKVDKITCAVDCGKVINPSGVKNQIEGGVVWALNALLYGGLDIQHGRATKTNFHQNKLIRMAECPIVEVHFVENSGEQPWGIGELAPPPTVPAIINAIFAATGKRIRKLPVAI